MVRKSISELFQQRESLSETTSEPFAVHSLIGVHIVKIWKCVNRGFGGFSCCPWFFMKLGLLIAQQMPELGVFLEEDF